MKKTIIAWLISLLSGGEQKEVTDNMLKACYPDHHLRHNPRKREKVDESIQSRVSVSQDAKCDTATLPLTETQVPGEAV